MSLSGRHEEEYVVAVTVHSRRMRRLALGLCNHDVEADDLVQEAMLRLYTAWPLRDPRATEAWLKQTLVRIWIDGRKRHRWTRETLVADPPETAAPQAGDGADLGHLLALVRQLPARQRACVVLRFYEDWSVEQTAQALRCSTGTVKSQTSRALEKLRTLPEAQPGRV